VIALNPIITKLQILIIKRSIAVAVASAAALTFIVNRYILKRGRRRKGVPYYKPGFILNGV
jgi:hypothetical protein